MKHQQNQMLIQGFDYLLKYHSYSSLCFFINFNWRLVNDEVFLVKILATSLNFLFLAISLLCLKRS